MMERKPLFTFEIDPAEDQAAGELLPILTYDSEHEDGTERILKVRLDKWLWAARFFKTRALARAAIEGGKIFYDGQIVMPSKEIELNAELSINQGRSKRVVLIRGLSTRRRSSDEADTLYEEVTGMYSEPNYQDQGEIHMPRQEMANSDSRPRKMVRFLRRSMNIGDSSSINRDYEHKDPIK